MNHADIFLSGPVIGGMDAPFRTPPRCPPDTSQVDTAGIGMTEKAENSLQISGRDQGATVDHLSAAMNINSCLTPGTDRTEMTDNREERLHPENFLNKSGTDRAAVSNHPITGANDNSRKKTGTFYEAFTHNIDMEANNHSPQISGRDQGAMANNTVMQPSSRLIKKKELASLLSISPRTVDDLVAKREIPYLALSPRLHLFDLEAVRHALINRFEVRAKGVSP